MSDSPGENRRSSAPSGPDSSPDPATAPALAASLAGRYRLHRRVGGGGMGLLLLGCDRDTGRPVVVKTPRPELLDRPGVRERFRREFRWMRLLAHPHLMPVLDVGETTGGVPYAVMPLLGGGSLRRRLRETPGTASADDLGGWLEPIASALDHLHARGVIHRDVTPCNILFDGEERAFLTDLGLACAFEGPGGVARRPRLAGHPSHIPPEAMERVGLGPAYDQYSLGVVAYEALCGALPVTGGSTVAMLLRKRTHPPRPLESRRPDLDAETCRAVMRALDRDPGKRFESCRAFADALRPTAAPRPR